MTMNLSLRKPFTVCCLPSVLLWGCDALNPASMSGASDCVAEYSGFDVQARLVSSNNDALGEASVTVELDQGQSRLSLGEQSGVTDADGVLDFLVWTDVYRVCPNGTFVVDIGPPAIDAFPASVTLQVVHDDASQTIRVDVDQSQITEVTPDRFTLSLGTIVVQSE